MADCLSLGCTVLTQQGVHQYVTQGARNERQGGGGGGLISYTINQRSPAACIRLKEIFRNAHFHINHTHTIYMGEYDCIDHASIQNRPLPHIVSLPLTPTISYTQITPNFGGILPLIALHIAYVCSASTSYTYSPDGLSGLQPG